MHGASGIVHHRYAIGAGCYAAVSRRIEAASAAADQESEWLWIILELHEEVVGQIELDGRKSPSRAYIVQPKLRCCELLVHVSDRHKVRAAAACVEIEAVVKELS